MLADDLPAVVAGDHLRRRVEKGDVAAPVDGEDADVQVVQDDFEAPLLVPDPIDEPGDGRMVLEDRQAAGHPPFRAVERGRHAGDQVADPLFVGDLHVAVHRGEVRFSLEGALGVTGDPPEHLVAVPADHRRFRHP